MTHFFQQVRHVKRAAVGLLGAAIAITLTGCAATGGTEAAQAFFGKTSQTTERVHSSAGNKNPEPLPRVIEPLPHVSRDGSSYIAWKPTPIQKQRHLPPVFQKQVTMVFTDRADITSIAERIALVTGVPVKLAPDVFNASLGTGSTTPRAAAPAQNSPTTAVPGAPGAPVLPPPPPVAAVPSGGVQSALTSQGVATRSDMVLDYTGSLAGLMNNVSARLGVSWKYESDAIHVFRYETRTFVLKALAGTTSIKNQVGASSQSSSSGGTQGTQATQSQGLSAATLDTNTLDLWESTRTALRAAMTTDRLSMNQASGSITVTDTPEALDAVAKIIEHENRRLSRQVHVRVQVFSVTSNLGGEYGVKWDMVWQNLNNALSVKFGSPVTLVGAAASALSGTVVPTPGRSRPWDNTQLVVNALSSVGQVASLQNITATALNNQPVPFSFSTQTSYLASVASNQTAQVGTSTQLTPGQVTTGFALNLLPHILDNDRVLLQYGLSMSELERLTTVSSGGSSIQTPEVTSRQFAQRSSLRNGETLMLTGLERNRSSTDRAGVLESIAPLGGSVRSANVKESIVILITPTLVEGAE